MLPAGSGSDVGCRAAKNAPSHARAPARAGQLQRPSPGILDAQVGSLVKRCINRGHHGHSAAARVACRMDDCMRTWGDAWGKQGSHNLPR